MTRRNIIIITATILVLVAALLGWQRIHENGSSAEPFTIGAVFPLTGPNASYGEQASQAITLAVKSVNADGGVDGRPLRVVYQDSQFQSAPALNAYQQLKLQGVRFFLTIGSQVSVTIGPRARADGNLEYELSAVTPAYRDGSPLTCRSALTADASSAVLARYLASHRLLRIATLVSNDEQGAAVVKTLAADLRPLGGDITDQESYQVQDSDFRTQIAKIDAANPDALVAIAPGQYGEILFRQLKELGFNKHIFSNNWTVVNQNITNLSLLNGVIFTDFAYEGLPETADSANAAAFKASFRAATGENPPIIAANAYDAVMILAKTAAASAGDPAKVANYITHLADYPGVSGSLTFDGDCEASAATTLRTVRNGAIARITE